MTSPQLRRVTQAAEKAAFALRARDTAICEAYVEGVSFAKIAAAAGLSRQRIHQIVRGER